MAALAPLAALADRGQLHLQDRLELGDQKMTGRPIKALAGLFEVSYDRVPLATQKETDERVMAIDLRLNRLGSSVGLDLAGAAFARGLTSINLGGTDLGDLGLQQLSAGDLPCLRHLALWSNDIGPAGMGALTVSKCWNRLNGIELADNALGDEGAEMIAASPARELRKLDLQWNGIGVEAAWGLGRAHQRVTVFLWENKIKEVSAQELHNAFLNLEFPRWAGMSHEGV